MIAGKEDNVDLVSQIYREMNETGKKKLKQVADQVMNIWLIVNGETANLACAGSDKKGKSQWT